MKFDTPLLKGELIKRYKRFLADIRLEDGEEITAHCANSGSMMGLADPGNVCWVAQASNPNRKLKYDWHLVEVGNATVGLNTSLPNKLVEAAIADGTIAELSGYDTLRREVKYGENSRIDILLSDPEKPDCYVEVKNVTLARTPPAAEFPDAKTARGTKHLRELAEQVRAGHRAVMVYLVQRDDCGTFRLAADIDPDYAIAFDAAMAAGVEAICYACDLSPEGIEVTRRLEIKS